MAAEATQVRKRSDIDARYKWNAESVFATPDGWQQAASQVAQMAEDIQQYKGRLSESPSVLREYMDAADALMRLMGKVFVYPSMDVNCDSNDTEAAARYGQAQGLFGKVRAANAFAEPELLAIGRETLEQWMREEPSLAIYNHYVDDLFRRQAHVRSAEVEEVLGMASEPFSTIRTTYGLLTSSDMKFKPAVDSDGNEVPFAQSSFWTLMSSPDRELRRTAWNNYQDAYLGLKGTLASNLAASMKAFIFNARARGYKSSLEASLSEDNVPVEVFHNLIDTFKKNIPTWHKYWRVRREMLGYDDLHPYDIWAPLTSDTVHVPYETAVDWISRGMKPLGDEYVAALRNGCLEDRWVDVYPNEGKRSGAFSNGSHDTLPFIMMSYDDDLGAMSTLAHELGHSMHSFMARNTQPAIYSGYTLFVAEVASNFNQALTRAYLMRERADNTAFQINLLQEAMQNFHRYFFIMPTLARFELEIHTRLEKGKGVAAKDMIELMTELFSEGYGGEMQIDHDRVGITWAQFGHLYSDYYVYQYATGISGAHALADKVLSGEYRAAERYIEALSAGGSLYPLETLQHAGIDMMTPAAVEATFGVLANMVDQLEALSQ
jgi:oligoendopeptidase F